MDVNEELKFLGKFTQKKSWGVGRGCKVAGWGRVGGGTKNRRYCTMYKKVLYNIKKIKKCWGRRRSNI